MHVPCRALAVAGLLAWLAPRMARAEDSVTYDYEDYREADGRVAVQAQYGLVQQDLGPDMHLKLQSAIDAIAGATPNGAPPATPGGPVPLSYTSDRRKAWSMDLSRQFSGLNVTAGYAYSRESDYVSNGWSVNTLTDFNQKNTTLLLGAAGTDDRVTLRYLDTVKPKHGLDLITGVTQLLDPLTSLTFNVGYGRSTGYLADPYRVVEKRTEVFPGLYLPLLYAENRPDQRSKWTAYAAINRSVPKLNGAVEASYRFYHDTFGTTAHTVDLAWFQKIGEHLILRPGLRLYEQTAANFYAVSFDGVSYTPSQLPNPAGPFYSADYRLSAFRSYNYGLKAIWTVNASWELNLAYEEYEMHGTDHVTSSSAYPRAAITTAGVKFSW